MSTPWYPGFTGWERDIGRRGLTDYLAEFVGAAVAGATAQDAEWWGGGNKRYYDLIADGVRIDVKRAWWHKKDQKIIGFGGKVFDTAVVDEILLALVSQECITTSAVYDDAGIAGDITLTVKVRPERIYKVPVPDLNRLSRADGKSAVRRLVATDDLKPWLVTTR